jgi:TIR domain
MARIFISHSSRDNDAANRMKAWLASQGFENAFLDKDKTTGIPPGADWEKTLYREFEQSQAVIILQTPDWLASKWCFAEFTQGRALGKAIFPVIETPTDGARIAPDIQTLDLTRDREVGLGRLSRELVRIALDAQGGFKWDASRPPFPGLLAFQDEDAAIYFGRDDDIRRLIERFEARRAQGGAKLIALLGSSGSGKSSLLRAGLIPRLKRAGRNWIVAPPIRPAERPVDGLAVALATAIGPDTDWRKIKDDLLRSDPKRALADLANDLRVKAGAGEAQILIPIDQAEELFGVADPDEARRFLEILSQALSEDLPFLAVMALRSDYLGELQSAASLTARFEEFSLGPMPLARIPEIIRGPARVAGLGVEEEFVQQAARDAETEDALPLLAFALRELLDRSVNKSLTLNGYKALGDENAGLTPLENAVRQAADTVLADAKPAGDELAALREAFVPAMVRVNDEGEYVRRPARWDELPAKSHPLLERLARARLLIMRQDGDTRVVEVAHEALLRKWPRLRSWLDAEREFLIGRQQLEQDLRDWEKAAETDKVRALLTGLKLDRAREWLDKHRKQLLAQERAFIQAGIDRVNEEEKHVAEENRRKARTRRNITWGSIAAALALAGVAGVAAWELRKAIANESLALTALSVTASSQGHYTDAVQLALAAWPRSVADQRLKLWRTIDALGQALEGPLVISPPLRDNDHVYSAAFSQDGARVLTASGDAAQLWDAVTGSPIGKPLQHQGIVNNASFSPDGSRVVTAFGDTARMWDAATGAPNGKPLQLEGWLTARRSAPSGRGS